MEDDDDVNLDLGLSLFGSEVKDNNDKEDTPHGASLPSSDDELSLSLTTGGISDDEGFSKLKTSQENIPSTAIQNDAFGSQGIWICSCVCSYHPVPNYETFFRTPLSHLPCCCSFS